MNREQAIITAKGLRKGMVVYDCTDGQQSTFGTTHETIGSAKRHMRKLGRGVALKWGERPPQPKEVTA